MFEVFCYGPIFDQGECIMNLPEALYFGPLEYQVALVDISFTNNAKNRKNIPGLFVSANFIDRKIFGDQRKQCLRILPATFKDVPQGKSVFWEPSSLVFVLVKQQELETIKLKLEPIDGSIAEFISGGYLSCTLRFSQNRV